VYWCVLPAVDRVGSCKSDEDVASPLTQLSQPRSCRFRVDATVLGGKMGRVIVQTRRDALRAATPSGDYCAIGGNAFALNPQFAKCGSGAGLYSRRFAVAFWTDFAQTSVLVRPLWVGRRDCDGCDMRFYCRYK